MRIYALCIGINDYGSQIAFPNLRCAVRDACEIERILYNQYGAETCLLCARHDILTSGIESLSDVVSSGHGTRTEILDVIHKTRFYIQPEDLFLFFFSGHGIADWPGYLVPYSAEYGYKSTYLMYKTLFATMATLPCRHIFIILNCCYAGVAAKLSDKMPGLLLSQKRAVLYAATDEGSVSVDGNPSSHNGCSPFAFALLRFLQEVQPGDGFSPENLAEYLKKNATIVLHQGDSNKRITPVYKSSMESIGAGAFDFEVVRPGFSIQIGPEHYCQAGERLELEINVRNGFHGDVKFQIVPKLEGFDPSYVNPMGRKLVCHFDYPGTFSFDLIATNMQTEETSIRTFTIHVAQAEYRPISLIDRPLQVCKRGASYRDDIGIEGGTPPFQIVIEGLPEGLDFERQVKGRLIIIAGKVNEGSISGTPLSEDNGPMVFNLKIHVKDGTEKKYCETRRLVVYNPKDYYLITEDNYSVGIEGNIHTINRICDIFRLNLNEIAINLRIDEHDLEELLNSVSANIAIKALNRILSTAPFARVRLRRYLIKKYPVTLHDWKRFLDSTQNLWIPIYRWPSDGPRKEDLKKPVTGISYAAICDYLNWKGTRLPTGREWQIAADGGKGNLYPWGNEFNHELCNMKGGPSDQDIVEVDAYDQTYESPMGTRDMVGNAAEWVDRRVYWHERMSFAQVFRGGSFRDLPIFGITSCDSREAGVLYSTDETAGEVGETRFDWLGFRDVIELEPQEIAQQIITIPKSEIQVGSKTLHVPEFGMARYAVSNQEYWEFVQATHNRRPLGWLEHGENLPFLDFERHLPVVNVSYLDAHFFCLWKSRICREVYRLPSAEQWLAALQGGEYLKYPWGDDFNLQFCNGITSGWGKRVPVWELYEGKSRQGIYNLVGNTYEWISPLELRGGSWLKDCKELSSMQFKAIVNNDRHAANFYKGDVGFRYVRLDMRSEK